MVQTVFGQDIDRALPEAYDAIEKQLLKAGADANHKDLNGDGVKEHQEYRRWENARGKSQVVPKEF